MGQLTVLFCGATGRLAGLTPVLLERGHRVLAAPAPVLATGRLPSPVSRFKPLQQIPIEDVLAFTARVLESRDAMLGERIEIASDEITAQQSAEIVSRLLGRRIPVADSAAASTNPLLAWLERTGTHVDIAALHRHYPELRWHTFTDWTKTQDWSPLRARSR